jgi:hypothetical protein
MKFHELNSRQVKSAMESLKGQGLILNEEVFIPEADIFLCSYKSSKFNIKFDIAYGTQIEGVSDMSLDEIENVEAMILHEVFSSTR